jgi:alkanesulfonate monooxygenase SsuD/methylene tetrahydromethanopterin reductase-like flavin-dependent oxidoreductase (luciferase family)
VYQSEGRLNSVPGSDGATLTQLASLSMLDNLSGGRVDLGLGRGITALEHTYWGQRREDAQRRFDETLEIMLKGLASDTLNHHGEFFDFDRVPIELAPMQRPYPPLWYASGSHEYAAREGMNFVTRPGPRLAEAISAYTTVLEANRHRAGRLKGHVAQPWIGSTRHIVVADTDGEAERMARSAYPAYQENFSKRGMSGPGHETRPDGSVVSVPPGGPGTPEAADFSRVLRTEAVLVGSP